MRVRMSKRITMRSCAPVCRYSYRHCSRRCLHLEFAGAVAHDDAQMIFLAYVCVCNWYPVEITQAVTAQQWYLERESERARARPCGLRRPAFQVQPSAVISLCIDVSYINSLLLLLLLLVVHRASASVEQQQGASIDKFTRAPSRAQSDAR